MPQQPRPARRRRPTRTAHPPTPPPARRGRGTRRRGRAAPGPAPPRAGRRAGPGPRRHRRPGAPVRPRPGAADRQPLAGQPEPHPRTTCASSTSTGCSTTSAPTTGCPPTAPRRNGGWDAPELPVPHPHAGPLPDRLGPGLRRARRHHLPGQGQPHGRRAGQVPGQQRRRRVHHRLPVRLPRVRLHRPRGRHAEQRQRAVLLHPQDPRRAARRVAATSATPRPATCCCALAGWVDSRTGRLSLQPDADDAGHRVRRHERGADRPLPADRRPRWLTAAQRFDHAAVVRPARRQPGPAQRPARQHPGAQVDRRRPRVQGHRHHPLPRHRRQRLEHHRSARTRTPSAATARPSTSAPPNAIAAYLDQRHLRALQHLQHAQADPGAVAARPRPRRATSTSTSGRCSTT